MAADKDTTGAKNKETPGKSAGTVPGADGSGMSGAGAAGGGALPGSGESGSGVGGANDRRMAQNLDAARGGLKQAVEQSSPSFQAASAIGSAIGVGGSAKSDEEYNLIDAIYDALVVTIMLFWGEGVAPLSSWLMEGLCKKNILRATVLIMIVSASIFGSIAVIVLVADAFWDKYVSWIPGADWVFGKFLDMAL